MRKAKGRKGVSALISLALAGTLALSSFGFLPAAASTADGISETEPGKWYTDFGTYEEERENAGKLTERIMEEGCVLLKNDGLLPFDDSIQKVTLFGARSYDPVTGGTGSGGGGGVYITLPDSMTEAGFEINNKVKANYENNRIEAATGTVGYKAQTVESPVSILKSAVGSYAFYGDVGIVTIARTGGEGDDLFIQNVATHADKTEHYLQLDDNERDLLAHVKEHFDKVVILLNIANPMEIGELVDDPDIDASFGSASLVSQASALFPGS